MIRGLELGIQTEQAGEEAAQTRGLSTDGPPVEFSTRVSDRAATNRAPETGEANGRTDRLMVLITTPSKAMIGLYIALCIALMMCFVQGDVLYNAFVANAVARGHPDVYSYFQSNIAIRYIDTVMPPLFYLATGAYLKLLMLIHLDPVSSNPAYLYLRLFNQTKGLGLSAGLLLLKLPNLIAVLAGIPLSVCLAKRSQADSHVVMLLWAASPVLLVTSLMQAQNDAIPAVITLAALVVLSNAVGAGTSSESDGSEAAPTASRPRGMTSSFEWAMILIGLASCFKSYALVLVPVTALVLSNRDLITVIRLGVLGVLPPVLFTLPFVFDHAFMSRVFGAHDDNTLLGASYSGRLPTHPWALTYLGVLLAGWIISRRRVAVIDIVCLWFVSLGMIFVVNWWVPQWVVWLLPMILIFAGRDRLFAWMWLALNALLLTNDLINYPGNMDGAMLMPFYGDRNHPANSHVYDYHLYQLWHLVPAGVIDGLYIVIGAVFLALCVRAAQWLIAGASVPREQTRLSELLPSARLAALIAPTLLLPYITVMVIQRLVA
ncbi:MAG TPA: hypothetical protein VG815_11130 [Chloroflexota bacterium]|nr:hypothetical protein [Chloroflexota bacterium]